LQVTREPCDNIDESVRAPRDEVSPRRAHLTTLLARRHYHAVVHTVVTGWDATPAFELSPTHSDKPLISGALCIRQDCGGLRVVTKYFPNRSV
jgi:hypothetical protein